MLLTSAVALVWLAAAMQNSTGSSRAAPATQPSAQPVAESPGSTLPAAAQPGTPMKPDEAAETPQFRRIHSFEIRSAKLLQRMILEHLQLGGSHRESLDRIFAAYVRDTIENRPRAVLLAFTADPIVATDGTVFQPEGEKAKDFQDGKVDSSRPYLVDQVLAALEPSQAPQVQSVVARWNKLRQQKPVDGPIMRLQRALTDPDLPVSPELRSELGTKAQEMLDAIPKAERRPPFAAKYEPEIREAIMAMLNQEQARKLKSTMDLLDSDAADWEVTGHIERVYEQARQQLSTASTAADKANKSGADGKPTTAAPQTLPTSQKSGGQAEKP